VTYEATEARKLQPTQNVIEIDTKQNRADNTVLFNTILNWEVARKQSIKLLQFNRLPERDGGHEVEWWPNFRTMRPSSSRCKRSTFSEEEGGQLPHCSRMTSCMLEAPTGNSNEVIDRGDVFVCGAL
jgi:hypothetical protein